MSLDIDARRRIQRLLDAYGQLLTEHQLETLRLHVDSDWSYAEIAAAEGVSRAAVFDLVRRAAAALEEYEAKLAILAADDRRENERKRLGRRLDGLEHEIANLRAAVKGLP